MSDRKALRRNIIESLVDDVSILDDDEETTSMQREEYAMNKSEVEID